MNSEGNAPGASVGETADSGIPRLVFQLTRELRNAFDRRMAAYDLTFQQASLLIRCVRAPGNRINELAPHLGTDSPGASRLVDRLEGTGLIRRGDGGDRRSIGLEPSDAGRALAPELERAFGEIDRQLVSGLSAAEIIHFRALLQIVLNGLKDKDREDVKS
jgi:DNA-binding MarR family transcriptional regulator